MAWKNTWNNIESFGKDETERMRFCRGCKYLSTSGKSGCCNYLLMTGKRRGCPFGSACTVREYENGYQPDSRYEEWCREVDARIDAERTKASQKAPEKKQRGKKRTWDDEYAFGLYRRGFYLFEIREVVDMPPSVDLFEVAMREWHDKLPKGVKFQSHDIELERRKYLEYKAAKDRKDVVD